ncbi:adrenodoxin-like protein 2, mitochondrial [Diorhabda carinulata]|uniref:adrenodoxin-like protein 2, mitochondrial n=1 Tax=Diorhabda sublineata TaxID=1163346 RepID=UPI0024E0A947|nr:adrenodoxin-like protein 2, mitochondrial [Diorhabda sublineata]XP_057657686.1 adrenodoxin-like protein 2, mitochondrial [Diorhabda carinulata]
MALNVILRNTLPLGRCVSANLVRNSSRQFCMGQPALNKKEIEITFVKANGTKIKTKAKVGENILDVVINNHIDIDGFGACEGTLTCSTCHLIFKQENFDSLPPATDEELDMLDLAYDLTDTSRLGCQVYLDEKCDGMELKVPATVHDARTN